EEAAMKRSLLTNVAAGLLLVAGTTPAWSGCRQVTVDGVSHQVCDNNATPFVNNPVPYGGGAFNEGARAGAEAYKLRMLLDALPPGPPPALPPGGANVAVTGSKVRGTVRMVTAADGLSGCALLGAVRDDEFQDLAGKVLKLGGTHALLTGTKGKYVLAQAYRCE